MADTGLPTSGQVDLGTMDIDHTDYCGNSDIIGLVAQIDILLRQLSRCPSATRNDVQTMDVRIQGGWISRFEKTFELFAKEPELYMPNASPKPKKMPAAPNDINIVQNPDIQHQMYELSQLRTQLLFSENRERLNGFHSVSAAEEVRPWIVKFKKYIDLQAEHIDPENAISTYQPDANLQDAGVNAGYPR
jgi:hypothetical protein